MAYAQRLVERILAQERARSVSAVTKKTYRDEPLLFTGTDLERRKASAGKPASAPKKAAAERIKTRIIEVEPRDAGTKPLDTKAQPLGVEIEPSGVSAEERLFSDMAASRSNAAKSHRQTSASWHAERRYVEHDDAQREFLRALKEGFPDRPKSQGVDRVAAASKGQTWKGARSRKKTQGRPKATNAAMTDLQTSSVCAEEVAATTEQDAVRMPKAPAFALDVTCLQRIREEAARSCEALLTDEERERAKPVPAFVIVHKEAGSADAVQAESPAQPNAVQQREACSEQDFAQSAKAAGPFAPTLANNEQDRSPLSVFSALQADYLRCVLTQGSAERRGALLQAADISEPLMLDALNEVFLEMLGDIALELRDGAPALIEEYENDVKELLP